MRDVVTTTSPRYAGGSLCEPAAEVLSPGEAAVLRMDGFEPPAVAQAEDQLRLARLQWSLPVVPPLGWTQLGNVLELQDHRLRYPSNPLTVPALDRAAVVALTRRLEANVEAEAAIYRTLASSVAMRTIRLELIGALLDALDEYPDEGLCTVTVAKVSWILTPAQLLKTPAKKIIAQFRADLKRSRTLDQPGPLVAFLHGEFEPTNGVYVMHFHIVTTRAKAAFMASALRRLKRSYRPTYLLKRPIRVSKMGDRVGQVSYMLKSFWPQRALRLAGGQWKRDRGYHRVCEPWSSIYLLWLDRHRLLDLTVNTGTWSRRKGGLAAWKAFSLMVEGVGDGKGSGG